MTSALAGLLLGLTGLAPDDLMTVSAHVATDRLEPGDTFEIVLDLAVKDGWSTSSAGIPAPLLQIKTPPSVSLAGETITDFRQLAKNEFIHEPYERLISETPLRIECKLLGPPEADQVISLNILAYLGSASGDDSYFVRKRLVLQAAPNARARPAGPAPSDWGVDHLLQLGDRAALFELPRADGTKVSLQEHLGKSNVIVTTYRAFW